MEYRIDVRDPNLDRLPEWRKGFCAIRAAERQDLSNANNVLPGLRLRPALCAPTNTAISKERVQAICAKLSDQVIGNWHELQQAFIDIDASGSTKIQWADFQVRPLSPSCCQN